MSSPIAVLYNRKFRRHRYVVGEGWVVSRDTFNCRVGPKVNDSISNASLPDDVQLFLSTTVFRDNPNKINSYVATTYNDFGAAEAAALAQSGTDLMIGDRLIEEDANYILMVRGVSEYRDGFNTAHDEINCSEASQLDKKWIEPVTICSITEPVSGMHYDPIRKQFIRLTANEMNEVDAFGVFSQFNSASFQRDAQLMERTEDGKLLKDMLILNIDADFPVTESTTLKARGKYWKIEYIREGLPRVKVCGISIWEQRGVYQNISQNELGHLTS